MNPYDGGYNYGVWLCPGNQEKLAELIAKHNVKTVLEIGSCYGASACWFAREGCVVTCVDLWCAIPEHGVPAYVFDIFKRNTEGYPVSTVHGDSHSWDTLAYVGRLIGSVDLVYIDGSHDYEGVRQDIEMYGPLATKVLCGDDYDRDLPSVAGVIRAVDECVPDRKVHGRFWYKENSDEMVR